MSWHLQSKSRLDLMRKVLGYWEETLWGSVSRVLVLRFLKNAVYARQLVETDVACSDHKCSGPYELALYTSILWLASLSYPAISQATSPHLVSGQKQP